MRKRPEPKTHCKHGHEFTPENTLWQRNNTLRVCRTCKREGENRRAPRYKDRKYRVRSLYKKSSPEKIKISDKRCKVKSTYGLTLEQFKEKLDSQDNLCAICGKPFEGGGRGQWAPALDHDHTTGTLRDFIHNRCNIAIGGLQDSAEICRLAAVYLEKHQENLCTNLKENPERNS